MPHHNTTPKWSSTSQSSNAQHNTYSSPMSKRNPVQSSGPQQCTTGLLGHCITQHSHQPTIHHNTATELLSTTVAQHSCCLPQHHSTRPLQHITQLPSITTQHTTTQRYHLQQHYLMCRVHWLDITDGSTVHCSTATKWCWVIADNTTTQHSVS